MKREVSEYIVLKRGWSLNHEGGLSSRWTFIRVLFCHGGRRLFLLFSLLLLTFFIFLFLFLLLLELLLLLSFFFFLFILFHLKVITQNAVVFSGSVCM